MANIYHGSWLRHLADIAVASARSPRRQVRQWFGRTLARGSPKIAHHIERIWKFVRDHDPNGAIKYAIDIESGARRDKDREMLWWSSEAFSGLEQYARRADCSYDSRRMEQPPPANDWTGGPVAGRLAANYRHRTPALPIRHARFIASAAARAGQCIVLCEPRLVPLLRRSFPAVEVTDDASASTADADATINHQDLPHFFGRSAEAIESGFVPLCPDPDLTQEFRNRYCRNGQPLIGVSWGSSNQAKEAPAFADWAPIFSQNAATFVSLQYGPIEPALKKLRRYASDNLIQDNTVNQMTDLDRFAAQVASLDAVISTSNTVVHLAGALGVPSVVILDESLLTWPLFSNRVPWYPRTILVHRYWREWPTVMKEAQSELDSLLAVR
jgi:hypothetical protein